jgi:phosphate starvation-inducible protein PhoH
LLFRHENSRQKKFQVELGDLQNEKEQLSSFLQSKLKVTVNQAGNKLTVKSEKLSVEELHHAVNKFVYHRNLNSTHYVSTEGTTVTINRFKGKAKKDEKEKKTEQHKKNKSPHQTAIQSWGL